LYLPKQEKAGQAAIFHAQNYFAKDSFNLALNGDGENEGFLSAIDNFGGTKAANLSKYYAGISYLNLGKFDEAIDQLKSYTGNDKMTQPMAYGAIGDAYMELNKTDDGLSYYRKAAQSNDNELTAPMFWIKYGNACEQFNQLDNAKDAYTTVTKKYAQTSYGRDAEKFLARIEAKITTK
jgi:tetratricopeptide (TPR) repeat protein